MKPVEVRSQLVFRDEVLARLLELNRQRRAGTPERCRG